MAITTYAELQTAVANWMERDDLTTRIPEFIELTEADINKRLATMDMETRATATLPAGQEYLALPDNFGGLRSRPKLLSTDPLRYLEYITPANMDQIRAGSDQGRPRVYTIEGNELRIRPLADTSYTVSIQYYLNVPALTDVATTNWLLTEHPDIYLFGTLNEAFCFIESDEQAVKYKGRYETQMDLLETDDTEERWSGGPLVVRSDVTGF